MDDILKSISAVVAGTVSGIIALFAYLHGKNREKKDFLINIIKMLDDNADRNARRRWFNTYGLKDDRDREICLDYMNALTEVKKRTNNEDEIKIYAQSNILESQYKTLSNFELASLYINRYTLNKLRFWRRSKSKLDNEILLQMYVLNFLSTRKIRDSDKTLKNDMIKRFINLEKFFNENEQYFKDKEGHYSDVTFPIKDVEKVKN